MSLCEVDRRITQSIVLMVTARVNKWTLASFDLKKAYNFQQHGFFESSGSKSFVVCHIFPERRQIWKRLNEMDICLLAFGTSLIQLKSEKHARANFPAFFRRSLRLDQTEMSTPSSRPYKRTIAGFHMTSLNFKFQNFWSSWDFTFMACKSSWKLIFIQIFTPNGCLV